MLLLFLPKMISRKIFKTVKFLNFLTAQWYFSILKCALFSDVPPEASSSISSSRQLSRKNSQRDTVSVLSGSTKPECKSENQSLLGAIGPLDWLFSDSDEPEPPSSPKLVTKSQENDNVNRGAIPKRPRTLPKQTSLDLQSPTNEDSSEAVDIEPVTDPDDTVEHSRQNR